MVVATATTIAIGGCGGGRSTSVVVPPPVTSGPSQTPELPMSIVEAANDPDRVSNVVAALGIAATTHSSTASGSVVAAVEYASATPAVSASNGSEWSIGSADGNPITIADDFGPWTSVALQKDLGVSALYVDLFTDIEAPQERVVESDGTIEGIDRSLARLDSNATISENFGASGLRGTYDGVEGVFSCTSPGTSRCRASGGTVEDGEWTFLPDRPAGAKDVEGVTGVVFTGTFDRDRTAGTLDGEDGYFRCTSQSCDHDISDGRLTSLTGDWIFVPTTREIVIETDSDYLTGGVWLIAPRDNSDADGYSFGAFATGNDPFDQGVLMSLSGAATYRGATVGIYAGQTADVEVGRFTGTVELIARFDSAASLGSIRGVATGFRFAGEPVDTVLILEETAIGSSDSGLFEGVLSGYSGGITYSGRWDGRFFGNDEASIKPGAVAGTFGGVSERSLTALVGTFGAYRH